MRKPFIALALIASTFVVPAVAFAAAPTVEKSTIQVSDPEFVFGSCAGFDMLAPEVLIERTIITWYDASGEPVREQRQAHFEFTLVNSASGTEAQYIGHFARQADFVAETDALIGAYRQLFIDHRNVWSASGMDALLPDGSIFSAGSMSLLEWEDGLCDAMA
jgi:hypothetical protein